MELIDDDGMNLVLLIHVMLVLENIVNFALKIHKKNSQKKFQAFGRETTGIPVDFFWQWE